MKPSKKESIKAMLILIGTLLIILVVIPVVTWMAIGWMVGNTEKGLRAELDNAVINENYADWKKADVPDWKLFMIPGEWEIYEESDVLHVTREEKEIAFGAIVGSETAAFADLTVFLEAMTGVAGLEIEEEVVEGFATISESTFTQLTVSGGAEPAEYYCITLVSRSVDNESDLCLLFPAEKVADFDELFESAQAIVFSFAFQTES